MNIVYHFEKVFFNNGGPILGWDPRVDSGDLAKNRLLPWSKGGQGDRAKNRSLQYIQQPLLYHFYIYYSWLVWTTVQKSKIIS